MSVTSHPTIKDHWIIVYYPEGRKKDANGKVNNFRERIVFGPCSFEEAKRYEVELIRSTRKVKIKVTPTFVDIFLDFCDYYKLGVSPLTYADFEWAWGKHLLPKIGHMKFIQLTPQFFDQLKLSFLREELKHKTINKILSYIASMVRYASDPSNGFCEPLPFKITGFSKKQTQPPPKQIPMPEEVNAIFSHLDSRNNAHALIMVMYYAGLRLGDARRLMRYQINIEGKFMNVIGKGMKQRIIPLTKELLDIIEWRMKDIKTISNGYLFYNPKTMKPFVTVCRSLDAACLKAGIDKHITHHSLRHAFAVHLLMNGANLRSVQLLLGHSSSQITEVYTQLAPTFLAEEMERLTPKLNAPNCTKA